MNNLVGNFNSFPDLSFDPTYSFAFLLYFLLINIFLLSLILLYLILSIRWTEKVSIDDQKIYSRVNLDEEKDGLFPAGFADFLRSGKSQKRKFE